VANYRQTVLTAFQSVEDTLSSWNHLQQQVRAFANIYQRSQKLFDSTRAQREVGTASQQDLLNEELTLLLATAEPRGYSSASLTQSSVTLIKNLGGGWLWDESHEAAGTSTSKDQRAGASPTPGPAAQ
jgi:outer membrane protein TolC